MKSAPTAHGRFADPSHLEAGWYWETDLSHRLLCVVAAPLGVRRTGEQAHGQPRWAHAGVDAAHPCWAEHRDVLARQAAFSDFAFALKDGSGHTHTLLISGEPVRDAAGTFMGYRGVGHDVTVPRRFRAALRGGWYGEDTVFDSAVDALIVTDRLNGIVAFNAAATRMFACERTRALGSPLARYLPEYEPPSWSLDDAPPAALPARATTALRADGLGFPADVSASPLQVAGRAACLLVIRDESVRIAREHEQQASQAQQYESRRMESLGTMAGGIAHDLNNIVAAVLGNAALARERLSDPHALRECLDQITQAGLRARDMSQRILTFSRRPSATFTVQPLQPVVHDAVRQLRALLPPTQRVSHRAVKPPLQVRADASQVTQIVLSLGKNAWQALDGRKGRIRVLLDRQGQFARLQVCDDGHGMDGQTTRQIFDPFFTTRGRAGGSGLGLANVHAIVRAHGGRIDVYSAPGQGATFEIFLPLATELETPLPPIPSLPVQRGEKAPHVVYLDDYPAMVLMVRATLQARGWRVSGFENARQALTFIRTELDDIDLVVSDYNMPDHSGLEVAREIQRLKPGLPVVLASGYLSDDLRACAAEAGVCALFDKPRGLNELCKLIDGILGRNVAAEFAETV